MNLKIKLRVFLILILITSSSGFTALSITGESTIERHDSFILFRDKRISIAPKRGLLLKAIPSGTISAASGLMVSSLLGYASEGIFPQNTGIVVALILSAIFSNLRWVPTEHAVYDLCWSLVLPASLFLLLIQESKSAFVDSNALKYTKKSDIVPVGLAFLICTIGSFLGCVFSFLICNCGFWLKPLDAVTAGASLCASYVGGSINFFATARILHMRNSLLSAMAAADLIVMASYFVWLTSAIQNQPLKKLFDEDDYIDTAKATSNEKVVEIRRDKEDEVMIPMKIFSICSVSAMACFVAKVASLIERLLNPLIPGTACGAIALLGVLIQKLMGKSKNKYWHLMQQAASPVASFAYLLFFASIGVSANLGQALKAGPACLLFSGTALAVHIIISVFGCAWWNKIYKEKSLRLRHVLVASNAAIGGPATAATFASQNNLELTSAATLWGIFGYGVGTNVGILMSKFLSNFV